MTGLPIRLKNIRFTEFKNAFLPSQAGISLIQQNGSAAYPCVSIGDAVKEGQLIASTADKKGSIHSPIPGIVREFREILMPNGKKETAIIVDLCGSFSILGKRQYENPWKFLSALNIIQSIENMGIVNTFDHPKLLCEQLYYSRKNNAKAVIVRLFDADPSCDTDGFVFRTYYEKVLTGVAIVCRAIDASSVFLVHTEKTWNTEYNTIFSDIFPMTSVIPVSVNTHTYPIGTQRTIFKTISKLLENAVHTSCTKFDIYIDALTALSVHDALVYASPVLERFVQVHGDGIVHPRMLKVRIGTCIGDIIEECGGFSSTPYKVIINGLLLGQSVYDLNTPVTKYTKSVCVLSKERHTRNRQSECVRCGACSSVCPVYIHPIRIWNEYKNNSLSEDVIKELALCEECAFCSCVCPSGIPLFQIISYLKSSSPHTELKGEIK